MVEENSASDVFRFVQLRPRRALDDVCSIALLDSTALAKSLAGAPSVVRRAKLANRALGEGTSGLADEVALGTKVVGAVRRLVQNPNATTADLEREVPALAQLRGG